MPTYRQMRIQQRLHEVEGYLELVSALGDRWRPRAEHRNRLACKALAILDQLELRQSRPRLLAKVNYLKGQAYSTMERYADAIQPLQAASQLDDDDIRVRLLLGWCYKRVGRLDLAIEALEEAWQVEPDAAIIYYNLACYWSLAGNAKLAVEYLARSFEIDESYRDLVASESDFDQVRNHPDFLALTTVIV